MDRKSFCLILGGGRTAACAHAPTEPASSATRPALTVGAAIAIGDNLTVTRLGDDIYLHVSKKELPGIGLYPSNGLLVVAPGGAILVDTAWTNAQTTQLIQWTESTLHTKVRELIITHSHDDRMGGIDAAIAHGITTRAFVQTGELAAKQGLTAPQKLFGPQAAFDLYGERVEVFYPGAAHSPDNVVVWFERSKTLVGGCMVRAAAAKDLGNAASADPVAWKSSIAHVIERYPTVERVIPGHGEPGGRELLIHTQELLLAPASAPAQ
jgi:metallo-beta-lactamase class B